MIYYTHYKVTPFVGVWIETLLSRWHENNRGVTPFVGVWIETCYMYNSYKNVESHTLRGCVD